MYPAHSSCGSIIVYVEREVRREGRLQDQTDESKGGDEADSFELTGGAS
jgi:hypothetical protein